MNPFSLGASIIGVGSSIAGFVKGLSDSSGLSGLYDQQAGLYKQQAEVGKKITADEMGINDQKQQQMQMQSQRMQLEQFRNIQRQRAMATASAVSQGAQLGTGLPGGNAQTQSSGMENVRNINQSLQFGNTIYGINNDISFKKMQIADIQAQLATNQGQIALQNSKIQQDQSLMSLGGSLVNNAGSIGNVASTALQFFA